MLTVEQAEKEMEKAERLTPGQWAAHSRVAADCARRIALACGMDGDRAYVSGLLHDIGRRNGSWNIQHIFDGYEYLTSINEPLLARISMTHSFPIGTDPTKYVGTLSCDDEKKRFIVDYYRANVDEYDDYDLLIQLCDSLALPSGAVIIEKRLVDVALRHGPKENTVEKWNAFFAIKKHFDKKCGRNIYTLLPDIAENSLKDLT